MGNSRYTAGSTAPMAEVLADPESGIELGYRLAGLDDGRNLLVAGHGEIVTIVFDRLCASPVIAEMRGRLYLFRLDRLDHRRPSAPVFEKPTAFDDFMFLPYTLDTVRRAEIVQQALRSVVLFCRRHGLFPDSATDLPRSVT